MRKHPQRLFLHNYYAQSYLHIKSYLLQYFDIQNMLTTEDVIISKEAENQVF